MNSKTFYHQDIVVEWTAEALIAEGFGAWIEVGESDEDHEPPLFVVSDADPWQAQAVMAAVAQNGDDEDYFAPYPNGWER